MENAADLGGRGAAPERRLRIRPPAGGRDRPFRLAPETVGFLGRIRQRKVCEWTVGYVAFAWLALQLVGVLSGIWAWPTSGQKLISLILGLGMLPALVVAWYHGEQGRQTVSAAEATLLAGLVAASAVVIWMVLRMPGAA